MNKRFVVALDCDDTCYEFVVPLLEKYNLRYDDRVSYGDITDWNIHQFLKPECKNIFQEFATEGFFEDLFIPASTVGWLSALNEIADIKFVTACDSRTLPWRAELLRRELDFFKDEMLIKLKEKWLIANECDYFIDDNEDTCNIVQYCSPHISILQVKRPWNGEDGYDTNEALAKVTREILRRREK